MSSSHKGLAEQVNRITALVYQDLQPLTDKLQDALQPSPSSSSSSSTASTSPPRPPPAPTPPSSDPRLRPNQQDSSRPHPGQDLPPQLPPPPPPPSDTPPPSSDPRLRVIATDPHQTQPDHEIELPFLPLSPPQITQQDEPEPVPAPTPATSQAQPTAKDECKTCLHSQSTIVALRREIVAQSQIIMTLREQVAKNRSPHSNSSGRANWSREVKKNGDGEVEDGLRKELVLRDAHIKALVGEREEMEEREEEMRRVIGVLRGEIGLLRGGKRGGGGGLR